MTYSVLPVATFVLLLYHSCTNLRPQFTDYSPTKEETIKKTLIAG